MIALLERIKASVAEKLAAARRIISGDKSEPTTPEGDK